ncbi:MAG: NAD(P)/FAD-dependent oxidoreductase, partial [Porticoccaceae bacterium]
LIKSLHRPIFLQQKIFGGLLRLINGDLTSYGLPKPDHKIFQTHPIMNTQILHYLGHGDCIAKGDIDYLDGKEVVFKDGSREQIDLIITATGYKHSVPFLNGEEIPIKNGRPDL